MPSDPVPEDDTVTVEIRHHGRAYAAEVGLSGRTTLSREGLWLCNADWNGRMLDTGGANIHADAATSDEILAKLASAVLASPAARPRTRPSKDAYPKR